MRHGQRNRAKSVCEALSEYYPRDGVVAAALADLLLGEGDAEGAIGVLRSADMPPSLAHAERALRQLGRAAEGNARWKRYLESKKGAARKWV